MALTDYYATLGLPHSTTQEAIKRAYRKLARKYHPDVSHEADAEERFKAVTEAHEALIDPERRAAYDAQWQQQQAQQASASAEQAFRRAGQEGATRAAGTADAPDDVNAFFETLFRRGAFQPGRDHHHRPRRNDGRWRTQGRGSSWVISRVCSSTVRNRMWRIRPLGASGDSQRTIHSARVMPLG